MRDDRETMSELTGRLDSLLGAFEERSAKGNGQAMELLRGTLNSALAKSGGTGVPLRLFIARPTDAQSWAACVVDIEASIGLEATRKSDGKPFVLRSFDVDGNTCVLESTEGDKAIHYVCPAIMGEEFDFSRDTFRVRRKAQCGR